MKKFAVVILFLFTLFFLEGCTDVSLSQNDIANLNNKVADIETLCDDINNNIHAIQTILSSYQNGNSITSISPLMFNGKEIGYTIFFVSGDTISIYHGNDGLDGKDGHSPSVGVAIDPQDDIWYWTVDGEWLLDANGQKVKAVGTNGANGSNGEDGKTPRLRIDDGYWYVSVDEGESWTKLEKATGDKGESGDAFFKSVLEDDKNVYFTLGNDTVITLSKAAVLEVTFEPADELALKTGVKRTISYNIISSLTPVKVEVVTSSEIRADVNPSANDGTIGTIDVIANGEINEYSRLIIIVSNDEKVIMRTVTPSDGGTLVMTSNAIVRVPASDNVVDLAFISSVGVVVDVPASAKDWLSHISTKTNNSHSAQLLARENASGEERSAQVTVRSLDDSLAIVYTIIQNAEDAYSVKMALGSYIPALESREIRIYYKSLFSVYDVSRYQVIVDGPIGKPYPRFWSFTPGPSDAGKSYDVRFSLVNDDGRIIASKSTSVKCISQPIFANKNILVLGASIYATGTISKEMCRQLAQNGGFPSGYGLSDIRFIGRLTGTIEADIHQEATGGWSWLEFANNSEISPFYNPSTKQIDFKYYSQQYCNNALIDVLCIEFGWNSLSRNISIIESVIKPFLRQFHKDYPNGVIVFGGLQPPSQKGGLGVNYGSSSEWNWLTIFRNVLDYNNEVDKICQDSEFCDYVFYWPACEMFDCETAYPTSVITSNTRTGGTEVIESNGLHPTIEGGLQLADSGVSAICYALSK